MSLTAFPLIIILSLSFSCYLRCVLLSTSTTIMGCQTLKLLHTTFQLPLAKVNISVRFHSSIATRPLRKKPWHRKSWTIIYQLLNEIQPVRCTQWSPFTLLACLTEDERKGRKREGKKEQVEIVSRPEGSVLSSRKLKVVTDITRWPFSSSDVSTSTLQAVGKGPVIDAHLAENSKVAKGWGS